MAVAIDTSRLALDIIPQMQRALDGRVGGDGRRFQIHRVSLYATILSPYSELWQQLNSTLDWPFIFRNWLAKQGALDWQADPDDDLGDAAVLQHLHQQAATVPLLSSAISQSDRGNSVTTLTGSALSASINARTQGRPLSSFHRHSFRQSSLDLGVPISRDHILGVRKQTSVRTFGPYVQDRPTFDLLSRRRADRSQLIVWAGPRRNDHLVFSQWQLDVVDLSSPRLPTSRPRKRQQTAFNQFLQVSHSPVVDDTFRRNPPPHAKRFNGVRHRQDRNIWVAEMKPPKHKTKQDFGSFKSEAEAARAVDGAFHHYGRPDLLNFPRTSRQFLSARPTAPAGLDEKAKVKFVKQEARLLLAAIAASSPLHSTHTNSFPILELPATPRRSPSGPFRSVSEISSLLRCSGPDDVDDVIPFDSICDISTTGVLTNLEAQNSVPNAEQVWDGAEDSCTLVASPIVVNSDETQSMWVDSFNRWSPAPTYRGSPSPSHFQEEIAYALLAHQSI